LLAAGNLEGDGHHHTKYILWGVCSGVYTQIYKYLCYSEYLTMMNLWPG
jgi:hypothetical protein